jgi:hypothetical protein
MAICRLMRDASFGPEETARIAALKRLGLVNRNDPVTEIVASKIIEIARTGERSDAIICDMALKELGISE